MTEFRFLLPLISKATEVAAELLKNFLDYREFNYIVKATFPDLLIDICWSYRISVNANFN